MHLLLEIVCVQVLFMFLQHSWTNFIYTRCQNINRRSKHNNDEDEESRALKKTKIAPEKHTYPSLAIHNDDDVAFERNIGLLQQEMSKPKPQFSCVTSLMNRTFSKRRQWILDEFRSVK